MNGRTFYIRTKDKYNAIVQHSLPGLYRNNDQSIVMKFSIDRALARVPLRDGSGSRRLFSYL